MEVCGPFPPVVFPPGSTAGPGGASQPPSVGLPREMASHLILHVEVEAAKEGLGEE